MKASFTEIGDLELEIDSPLEGFALRSLIAAGNNRLRVAVSQPKPMRQTVAVILTPDDVRTPATDVPCC